MLWVYEYFSPSINICIAVLLRFYYFYFIASFFRFGLYLQSVNAPFWSCWEEAAKRKLHNASTNTVISTLVHFTVRHNFVYMYKFWIFLTQAIKSNTFPLKFDFKTRSYYTMPTILGKRAKYFSSNLFFKTALLPIYP